MTSALDETNAPACDPVTTDLQNTDSSQLTAVALIHGLDLLATGVEHSATGNWAGRPA